MNNRAQENLYIQMADSSANKSILQQERKKEFQVKRRRLIKKYNYILKLPAREKLVYLSSAIAHFCLAVLAGLNLTAVLYEANRHLDSHFLWQEMIKAFLPIAGILGLSLIIGLLFWRIRPKRDPIVPKKITLHRGYLVGVVVGVLLYTCFLWHIVDIGKDLANIEYHKIVNLILFLGAMELFTGLFAVHGWETMLFTFRLYVLNLSIQWANRREKKWRMKSDRYYHYYLQVLPDPGEAQMPLNLERVLSGEEGLEGR